MAHSASDGRQFTNRSAMRRHEERIKTSKNSPHESEMHGEHEPEEDVHQVAEEHGPADKVTIEHENVHSVHPDGYEHSSSHESPDAAHEAGKCLAGACEHAQGEGMGDEEGHSGIPGLTGF